MDRRAGLEERVEERVSEQSFTDLLAPLVLPAYRLACAMLHDAPAAEDVVQEASLIAWRKLPSLRDRTRLRAWFLGIVANECRNARRRKWTGWLALPGSLSTMSSEEDVVIRADLRRALIRLSHEDRLVVVLYFYLDMPLADVAAVVGASADAARARLYRAIHRLRPDLDVQEALE
ncbi:MAG TPA: sigma-70 family RNA polymerase sigma factor [Candidatus Dormibacteraeota bacterium]|nr:sigma-70 family RNA polymerase sigma factor [Candidatus Dormibacteraeota bacterium]